jgi:3-methyl-2-oxobutanoate hydroxymethyltransferase
MPNKKPSIFDLYQMKEKGEKIAWLTSYDFPTAQFAQAAGMEMLLVGDSLGMCVYGYNGTLPVTMDQCIVHTEAVRRGAPKCFIVGDMPLGSYQSSDEQAVDNAIRFLKEADVDAIKLEGGVRITSRIQAITDAGINVIGHIGLTPQSSGLLGGHKAQGRTAEAAKLVVEDAIAVEKAGAKMLLVEAVPPEVTKVHLGNPHHSGAQHRRGSALRRPASYRLGPDRPVPGLHPQVREEILQRGRGHHRRHEEYVKEVKAVTFPDEDKYCYHMVAGEEEKFLDLMKKKK